MNIKYLIFACSKQKENKEELFTLSYSVVVILRMKKSEQFQGVNEQTEATTTATMVG
jgi:hypothetical protein